MSRGKTPNWTIETESLRLDLEALNRIFETQDVSKKYSFETVPTNYIVWQTRLIANFGLQRNPKLGWELQKKVKET